jgi:mono/diheme cytochrome c family protein
VSGGGGVSIRIGVPHAKDKRPGTNGLDSQLKQKHIMKKLFMLGIAAMAMAALSARAGDAKALYDQSCAKCHGAEGKGDTKMGQKLGAKDYSDAKVQDALKDDAAFKSIKEGLKDKDGKTAMKPAEGIADDDIKGLVTYMRTFKK